jgi:hypothetical protein
MIPMSNPSQSSKTRLRSDDYYILSTVGAPDSLPEEIFLCSGQHHCRSHLARIAQ